ncbi:hypothetical protein ACRRTK_008342 [Alexandromys fortis]
MSPPCLPLLSSICYMKTDLKSERKNVVPSHETQTLPGESQSLKGYSCQRPVSSCRGLTVFRKMALSKEVCLPAVKCPFKPFFFLHISHRVFVELVTYCMSVPRAGEESRQRLNPPPPQPIA